MQIYHEMRTATVPGPSFLSIGNFDGLHRGHQALLAKLRRMADANDPAGSVGLLTFSPHPLAVLRPDYPHQILTTPEERMHLAAAAGADFGVIQRFDHELSQLSARDFVLRMKRHLGLAALIVGPDFALGRAREGDISVLKSLGQEFGFSVTVMEPVVWQGKPVRSSIVRHALRSGNVAETAELLGRFYGVTGIVKAGDRRGRLLGIPTANIFPDGDILLPADGVYATRATVENDTTTCAYQSVTNLGVRPTVDGLHHRVETHLLDYPPPDDADALYGATIRLEFLARLRGEKRFNSVDALVAQIQSDITTARGIFAPLTP